MTDLSFSEACERNKGPILEILRERLPACGTVLEIGAGTGQHAVYFATHLPGLYWQASDRKQDAFSWASLTTRIEQAGLPNLYPPRELDVDGETPVTPRKYNAIYSANTAHIMSWAQVERMFDLVAEALAMDGRFFLYGPFNYSGSYTSESNRNFDIALRGRAGHMGIRDITDISKVSSQRGLGISEDFPMPANNRLLEIRRL